MRRRLFALTGILLLTAAGVGVGASPARAAVNIVATAVALSPNHRCSNGSEDVVLYSCFGDLGTCPTTAEEADRLRFRRRDPSGTSRLSTTQRSSLDWREHLTSGQVA